MGDNLNFDVNQASDVYINNFVSSFIEKNSSTINGLAYSLYKDGSKLSNMAFKQMLQGELSKACYSFVNNEHKSEYIDSYLFSCIHKTIKIANNEGKKSAFICPGCKYFSKLEILDNGKILSCNSCKNALNSATEKWQEIFYATFAEHGRKGYNCPDCNNFIPDNGNKQISCPYPNCVFVGNISEIPQAKHPTVKANLEIPFVTEMQTGEKGSDAQVVLKDDFSEYIKIIRKCIDDQIASLHFKSNNSTLVSKYCMYQAYINMLDKFPYEMISYLVYLNRTVRMQHKIFQEFIRLLEERIPFTYKKNGKSFDVISILDENLCVFSGISEYESIVDDNYEIENATNELYVGGRKGSYCRPYYIGKLISVIDMSNEEILTNSVAEYSFFKIKMSKDIKPGTRVKVKHLRIPPHYQMGGMVYLNRIRRAIVDRVYFMINGKKRIVKNEKIKN